MDTQNMVDDGTKSDFRSLMPGDITCTKVQGYVRRKIQACQHKITLVYSYTRFDATLVYRSDVRELLDRCEFLNNRTKCTGFNIFILV